MRRHILPIAFGLLTLLFLVNSGISADIKVDADCLRSDSLGTLGQVLDPDLRRKTGWRLVRAFAWKMELEDPERPGTYEPVDTDKTVFHTGQRFRLAVEAFCELYIYIVVTNADGTTDLLVPKAREMIPRLCKGELLSIPDMSRPRGQVEPMKFGKGRGVHHLRIIAAATELPWESPADLLKLENGYQMNTADRDFLARIKSVGKKNIGIIRSGGFTKGADVFRVEKTDRKMDIVGIALDELVSDRKQMPVLVHEIKLKQVD